MSGPRRASDIMVRDVFTVAPGDHVYDGMRLLLNRNVTGAPVVDDSGAYLGVFSEKCCLRVLAATAPEDADMIGGTAADCMTRDLVTLSEDTNAVDAMEILLRHRISGAPVVDEGQFKGVFSERFAMNVLMAFIYDQVPGASVRPFANRNMDRVVAPDLPLRDVNQRFLDTSFRRLPVLDGDQLVGQISRRDVLRAPHHLTPVLSLPTGVLAALDATDAMAAARALLDDSPLGGDIEEVMDREARIISPDMRLLDIAQIFMSTDLRRLPVVEDGQLRGQLSRRDVLEAFVNQLKKAPSPERALLYLSAVNDEEEARAVML